MSYRVQSEGLISIAKKSWRGGLTSIRVPSEGINRVVQEVMCDGQSSPVEHGEEVEGVIRAWT